MEINKLRLNRTLSKYKRMIIYGSGKFAKETYSILCECNRKPEFCLVTKKEGYDWFGNIPIYEIKEQVGKVESEDLIIISVSQLYELEIEQILKSYDIYNYISILQYDRNSRNYLRTYRDMSAQECIEEMAAWHIGGEAGVLNDDIRREVQRVKKNIFNKKNEKKIVFVAGAVTPRSLKIANALIVKGYNIKVFISPEGQIMEFCKKALMDMGIIYINCESIEELMYRIVMESAKVVHLFTHRDHSEIDRILIKMKEIFPPVVYDEYDIVNECYNDISKDILDNERYCLEHATAICNRGFEIDFLIERCNYKIDARILQFHDYCSDKQCYRLINDDSLSICYVGAMLAGISKKFGDWFIELAEKCKKNKCHFHIYPNKWDETEYRKYIDYSNENTFFHFHKPVSFESLHIEISKYDYGVFPISEEGMQEGWAFYKKEKMVYCTTNKYFDYLDAGLPIIAASSIKMVDFLKRRNVLIEWTISQYDFDELRKRKNELKQNVLKERTKLCMKNHIDELIDFYNML